MSISNEIELMNKKPHCANCGDINPPCVDYGDTTNKGYTECCDEAVCTSQEIYFFGNNTVSMKACCWAMAERLLKIQGINVLSQSGMSRVPVDGMDENL